MGYGPLVRASTGVSRLWNSGEVDDAGFYDATTIFPDHVVARITAIGALAALIGSEGAHVHISQAEAAVNQLATSYASEAARAAGLEVCDDDAVDGVYPCAGNDEWCVISVRSDADRVALAKVIGFSELPMERAAFATLIADWTTTRDKSDVVALAQEVGLAAGPMNRAIDVLADPQVAHRGVYVEMVHPLFATPMTTEAHCAPFGRISDAALRPAPTPGEHTRVICREMLGITAEELERLIADGALFAPPHADTED